MVHSKKFTDNTGIADPDDFLERCAVLQQELSGGSFRSRRLLDGVLVLFVVGAARLERALGDKANVRTLKKLIDDVGLPPPTQVDRFRQMRDAQIIVRWSSPLIAGDSLDRLNWAWRTAQAVHEDRPACCGTAMGFVESPDHYLIRATCYGCGMRWHWQQPLPADGEIEVRSEWQQDGPTPGLDDPESRRLMAAEMGVFNLHGPSFWWIPVRRSPVASFREL